MVLSVPCGHRGSEEARCHSRVTVCITEELDRSGKRPVSFTLQEGKLRLREETDLPKIINPARGEASVSFLHAWRPHQAFVVI